MFGSAAVVCFVQKAHWLMRPELKQQKDTMQKVFNEVNLHILLVVVLHVVAQTLMYNADVTR